MKVLGLMFVAGLLLAPVMVTAQSSEKFDPTEVFDSNPGEMGQVFSPEIPVSNNGPLVNCPGCGADGQELPFVIDGAGTGGLTCNGPKFTFESGVPATWSSEVWTGAVYWSTTDDLTACDNGGNQTLGSGEAACADSDQTNIVGDPYDTELFSTSFDLPGTYTAAFLRFAANYNDISPGGNDQFEVWVWNAGVGFLVLQWDEDHNEVVTLDLTPYLGMPDVEVSIRYHGDGWDWWAQVDDISLNCPDLFYDGFESGDTLRWSTTVP